MEGITELSGLQWGTVESYPWMLLIYRKIGHGNIFMVKDTNTLSTNLQAESTHSLYAQFIFYGLFEVAQNSPEWSKSCLTSLTLDPYFTDHTTVTIACISWLKCLTESIVI